MTMNPKPGKLPADWDALTPPNGATILVIDQHLTREDVVDRIDALADSDIQGANERKDLTKLDMAKLYLETIDADGDPEDVADGRMKGDVLRLLADEIGFFASREQEEIVKEQSIQVLLYLKTGLTAPRMPSLPTTSRVSDVLDRHRTRRRFPATNPETAVH